MRHIFFLSVILFSTLQLVALNSFHPYLKNYELPLAFRDAEIRSVSALHDQTLLVAVPKGVLSFDGSAWSVLTVPAQPTKLYFDAYSGNVFLGCEKSFGLLHKSYAKKLEYTNLSDTSLLQSSILDIASYNERVYFLQSSAIICYDTQLKRVVKTWKSDKRPYQGMFVFGGKLFVTVEGKGLYELKDNGAKLVSDVKINKLLVHCPKNSGVVLCGDDGSSLFFDGTKVSPFDFKSKEYVMLNKPVQGLPVDAKHCAIGTKNAGVVILDLSSGDVVQSINYQTFLPDDEVKCMFLDGNSGLWIGHGSGLTRADLMLEVADFSNYPGLAGTVQTSLIHNNVLYVGTTEGVYYLTGVKDYTEVTAYTRKETSAQSVQSVTMMRKVNKIVRVSFQNKNGKGNVTKDIPVEIEVPVDSVIGVSEEKFVREDLKQKYLISSFPLQFRKVDGVSAKCLHLCPAGDKILVGTNNGLYSISRNTATVLLEQANVRYIEPSINDNYFALSSAGLLSFAYDKSFEIVSMNESLIDASALDYSDGILWITSVEGLRKIRVSKGRYFGIEEVYPLTDYFPEDNVIAIINGLPTVFTYSDAYVFDLKSSELHPIKTLDKYVSLYQRPVVNQQNFFWVKGPERWSNLKDSVENETKGFVLNLFDHIKDIQRDKKDNLWVVSEGRLYKVYGNIPDYSTPPYKVSVNSLNSQSPFLFQDGSVELNSKNLGLEINFSAKYYMSEDKTTYRYRLRGLSEEWSEWSKLNTIKYPYIPGGNYQFELESKNVFGQISSMDPLGVEVHVPFWEQWWFFLGFGSLIIGGLTYVFASKTAVAGAQEV